MASDLVERDDDVAALRGVLGDVAEGRGRVALIEGPAGIGKTRLLAQLRREADATAEVLTARGSELEREFPFGTVRQLFEGTVAAPAARERLLAGAAAPATAVFSTPGAEAADPGDGTFAALHGLFWLTLNVAAERPLVLCVDDLQWCDRASLRFFAYLVRRLEDVPVLVATTLRDTDPGTDPALLAEIAHDPACTAVRPGPLTEAAVAELVRERLGRDAEPAFCRACHTATGGNPLMLLQLLSALQGEGVRPTAQSVALVRDIGPRAVSRTVLLRLTRLREEAVAVAKAVAILGDSADLPTVAELAGLGEEPVATAWGALARAEILRPEPPLGFVHPLVRDVVYRELAPGERELAHQRAAEILAGAGAPDERVAAHLLAMPRRGDHRVSRRLQRAGRAAIHKGAPDSAVAYLRRALEEPPPEEHYARVVFELGLTESLTRGPDAAGHLREAYDGLRDPMARAVAAWGLMTTLIFVGRAPEANEFAARASAELPADLADMGHGLEAMALMTKFFGYTAPGAPERLRALRDAELGEGPGAKMLMAVTAFDWALHGGDVHTCVALAQRALAGGDLVRADNGFLVVAAAATLLLADRDDTLDVWSAAEAEAHRHGSIIAAGATHLWHGYTRLRRGELAEAERLLHTAIGEVRLWSGAGLGERYGHAFLAMVRVQEGDFAAARALLGDRPPGLSDASRMWLRAHIAVLLAEGRAEEALPAIDDYREGGGTITNPGWVPWRSLRAMALHRLGRHEEAVELARSELADARAWGAPGTVGRSLRILGIVAGGDEGTAALEEAVAILEGSTARLEHARALTALGGTMRRARRPSEAREPLRRALELADVCGATALVETIRAELYASGARPRTAALSGPATLTASERRVAELAAAGQSNRDIAQALFVTPKTVEVHLSNSYRKLGIRSRRELPGVLEAEEAPAA